MSTKNIIGPGHDRDLELISNAQMPLINTHAGVSSRTRGQIFCPNLHLYPYFVYASRKCSGDSAHMRRLESAFVAR